MRSGTTLSGASIGEKQETEGLSPDIPLTGGGAMESDEVVIWYWCQITTMSYTWERHIDLPDGREIISTIVTKQTVNNPYSPRGER